ncbi:hypothetical protein NPIL_199051 [Nephila pilipes]|uniref:Uncharacterized protein n=1 Tax=Nephila pilipes TaxID=299642 RepID=A0A8X6NPA0_NEPPI|nr:hypothetical protein NPIL_199051 [Nephila pilipes]
MGMDLRGPPSVSQPPSGVKFFKACHYGVPRVTCRGCEVGRFSETLFERGAFKEFSFQAPGVQKKIICVFPQHVLRKSNVNSRSSPHFGPHRFTEPKTRVFEEEAVKPIGINLKNFYLPEERFDPYEGVGMEEEFGILFPSLLPSLHPSHALPLSNGIKLTVVDSIPFRTTPLG